jgi:hypothetical protein
MIGSKEGRMRVTVATRAARTVANKGIMNPSLPVKRRIRTSARQRAARDCWVGVNLARRVFRRGPLRLMTAKRAKITNTRNVMIKSALEARVVPNRVGSYHGALGDLSHPALISAGTKIWL